LGTDVNIASIKEVESKFDLSDVKKRLSDKYLSYHFKGFSSFLASSLLGKMISIKQSLMYIALR
jgi:hypothetical protein